MNDASALLPAGFQDALPPKAEVESRVVNTVLKRLRKHGYEQIKPPLVEFEETLLSNASETLARQTFRFMDPASQRMLGLRADMTNQIARIANTRMRDYATPLRISYTGQVLRASAENFDQQRQSTQTGMELIGNSSPKADVEILRILIALLEELGISDITVDFSLPMLVPLLTQDIPNKEAVLKAIEHKDISAITQMEKIDENIKALLTTTGKADAVIPKLEKLALPEHAKPHIQHLKETITLLNPLVEAHCTIDMLEHRGLDYYNGISFALFSQNSKYELARGGRYSTEYQPTPNATGCTLNIDALCEVVATKKPKPSILIPLDSDQQTIAALHKEGWQTQFALDEVSEPAAQQAGCKAYFENGEIIEVSS